MEAIVENETGKDVSDSIDVAPTESVSPVLVIKSFDELSKLTKGDVETIEVTLVQPDIASDSDNGYLAVYPMVVLYSLDEETGYLNVLLDPPTLDEDGKAIDQPKLGFTPGSIASTNGINATSVDVSETGEYTHHVNLDSLYGAIASAGLSYVESRIGVNLNERLGIDLVKVPSIFYMGNTDTETGKTNLPQLFPVRLDVETFKSIIDNIGDNKVPTVSVKFGDMISSLDMTVALNKLVTDLINDNFEEYGARAMFFVGINEVNRLMANIKFEDLITLAKKYESTVNTKKDTAVDMAESITEVKED